MKMKQVIKGIIIASAIIGMAIVGERIEHYPSKAVANSTKKVIEVSRIAKDSETLKTYLRLNGVEVEEPIVEEPIIEEPVIEEPVIEEPVIQEVYEPIVEEPIVEEPITDETPEIETVDEGEIPSAISNYTTDPTTTDYILYAWYQFGSYGWSEYDLECLITLWHRESHWNPLAHNSYSGAHGIPQALPAEKMASHGADYWDNGYTQILWGLDYIYGRYGSPQSALAHSNAVGWY